jgi:hypothetical protein
LSAAIEEARAEQFGLFTYEIIDGSAIEITDYPETESGHVDIPELIDGLPVTTIGDRAFDRCAQLTSITLPATVTSINIRAFASCTGISSVTIPEGVTVLGFQSFYRCAALSGISLPTSLTTIGRNAFYGCEGLGEIVLPQGLSTIGENAFSRCVALSSVTIPASVTEIGVLAFSFGRDLGSILVEAGNQDFVSVDGVLFNADQTSLIQHPPNRAGTYVIPDSVTQIASAAFSNCGGLTSVTIPDGISKIDQFTFHSCKALTGIRLPESVTTIYDGAFFACSGLSTVTFPEAVGVLNSRAFAYCDNLTRAQFMGSAHWFSDLAFLGTAPDFAIYYLKGAYGFTSSTWKDYPSVEIDTDVHPAASWLMSHDFPFDADLDQEPQRNGVSLLMAYALNLDPRLSLVRQMPVAVLGSETLSMSFHGVSPGITYVVESSEDLKTWSANGVSLSNPDPGNRRTASIGREAASRYLRLRVEN